MNKYLALLIAMSSVIAVAAAASAGGAELTSMDIGGETYYLSDGGVHQEDNECPGLQSSDDTFCASIGKKVDADSKVL